MYFDTRGISAGRLENLEVQLWEIWEARMLTSRRIPVVIRKKSLTPQVQCALDLSCIVCLRRCFCCHSSVQADSQPLFVDAA